MDVTEGRPGKLLQMLGPREERIGEMLARNAGIKSTRPEKLVISLNESRTRCPSEDGSATKTHGGFYLYRPSRMEKAERSCSAQAKN
mgnify:CR=1 FL=1